MARKLTLLCTVAILLVLVLAAQHSPIPASASPMQTAVATAASGCDLSPIFATISRLKTTKDQAKDLDALVQLSENITTAKAVCAGTGLSFSGTTVAKLVGPFELPAGKYKATATTKGFLIIHMTILDGDCDSDGSDIMFNLSSGEGLTGAESIVSSSGCQLMLKPSNISAPWKLTIEPLQ